MTLQNCLEVTGIGVRFGGLQALKDVSFELRPGQVTALIGPNGAGKTTMINVISGALRPTTGSVKVDGRDITRQSADRRQDITRTFQISQVFKGMTVLENVMVGLQARGGYGVIGALLQTPKVRQVESAARQRAMEILDRVGIAHLAGRDAGTLPLGQERLLEVARALASDPRVILLDEVASGLTPPDRHALAKLVHDLRDSGYAILVVEHNMRFVKDTSEKLVVLNFGELIYAGTVADGLSDSLVMDAYLGRAHEEEHQ